MDGAVLVRRRRHGVRVLHVVGDDDRGHAALGERDPQARSTRWRIWAGSIAICTYSCATSLNSVTQVDLLLVVAAEASAGLLADDRDDRLVVELGVVEAVEQVDRAGAGGRHADAELAR